MTTFIAWAGVDSRGPSSVNFVSDSRISWGCSNDWDNGRKLFASRNRPDLLGYVGAVLFPSLLLGQITSAIDAGVLFHKEAKPDERFAQIKARIKDSCQIYPSAMHEPFTMVYATREGEQLGCTFHLYTLTCDIFKNWTEKKMPIPERSDVICAFGSGKDEVLKYKKVIWDQSEDRNTSRAVFYAFCDALNAGTDVNTGGAPQIVKIHRVDTAVVCGVIHDEHFFLYGIPIDKRLVIDSSDLKWGNKVFEIKKARWEL